MEYKKFGDLSREEKLELMVAWIDAVQIQFEYKEANGCVWENTTMPSWDKGTRYRIAPKPIVKPSVNWDHVADVFTAMAVDMSGTWFVYERLPFVQERNEYFSCNGAYARANCLSSLNPGTFVPNERCTIENWQDSIVFRPGHEPKGKE